LRKFTTFCMFFQYLNITRRLVSAVECAGASRYQGGL
jgi:hypothetical protein